MRSNDKLHSQFNPGAWDFIHRTDCREYVSPNPGHLWCSKSQFLSCLIVWTAGQREKHVEEAQKQKSCWKVLGKKSVPLKCYTLYNKRREICRPCVAIQQTLRFINSAATPPGLRLIAGWIKPLWLTYELQHWRDMRVMNVEQIKVILALSALKNVC